MALLPAAATLAVSNPTEETAQATVTLRYVHGLTYSPDGTQLRC